MSTLQLPEFVPAREMLNGKIFFSPLGVFDFQALGLAECYLRTEDDGGVIAVWDTGIGKTVLGLLLSAYLFEDREIDLVMVVCEKNKVREWQADYERFTALSTLRYHDAGRHNRLKRHGIPHVVITGYETGRDDLMQYQKRGATRGKGSKVDGPLVEQLGLRDKRILWIFDEPIKFKNRSSTLYQSYWYTLSQLRRGPHAQRVVGLTATPMDTEVGQAFNVARMIAPKTQPTVAEFEELCTLGVDDFRRYRYKAGAQQVYGHTYFQPIIIRKRKTDKDVIAQFPKLLEERRAVTMTKDHRDFYNTVMTMCDPPDGVEEMRTEDQIVADENRIRTLLRMTAGHPASHLHVRNELSRRIVEEVTEEGLRTITSSKTVDLIVECEKLIKGQGAQLILFEYYTSVIKEVARELREAGFSVGEYHGSIDEHQRERNKAAFKAGEIEILFLSDAGARGINLQNAQYVTEYSSSTTYSNRVQRGNRNNRIDSEYPSTTLTTMVLDGTCEERIFVRTIDRNKDLDSLVGDEEDGSFVSADTRRELLDAYHDRRRGRSPRKDTAA